MPVTVRNTDILFNDGTTQSTAAGAIPTAFGAVGTYVVAFRAVAADVAAGATVAGSELRHSASVNGFNGFNAGSGPYPAGGSSLSGTWRKMGGGRTYFVEGTLYGNIFIWGQSLWVRIS
jgi:hypothetical protein